MRTSVCFYTLLLTAVALTLALPTHVAAFSGEAQAQRGSDSLSTLGDQAYTPPERGIEPAAEHSDSDVRHAIQAALDSSARLSDTHVTATVTGDSVILDGWVTDQQELFEVMQIADQLAEGRDVISRVGRGGAPTW